MFESLPSVPLAGPLALLEAAAHADRPFRAGDVLVNFSTVCIVEEVLVGGHHDGQLRVRGFGPDAKVGRWIARPSLCQRAV